MLITLLHGSTQTAAGFDLLAERLRVRGHEVLAPDLPRDEPSWDLRTYAALIPPADVVVAHSFAGVFLPHVECRGRVFLAALVPEPRKSVRDQIAGEPPMFTPEWMAASSRWLDPSQHQALARQFLFHDCDEATTRWALTTVELFRTLRLAVEPNPFDRWPEGPILSVVCTADRAVTPEWCRVQAASVGARVAEIDAGHAPHVSRPEELADAIDLWSAAIV
jgi:pimeloyl-ACP methyl ester carboxylesterase